MKESDHDKRSAWSDLINSPACHCPGGILTGCAAGAQLQERAGTLPQAAVHIGLCASTDRAPDATATRLTPLPAFPASTGARHLCKGCQVGVHQAGEQHGRHDGRAEGDGATEAVRHAVDKVVVVQEQVQQQRHTAQRQHRVLTDSSGQGAQEGRQQQHTKHLRRQGGPGSMLGAELSEFTAGGTQRNGYISPSPEAAVNICNKTNSETKGSVSGWEAGS